MSPFFHRYNFISGFLMRHNTFQGFEAQWPYKETQGKTTLIVSCDDILGKESYIFSVEIYVGQRQPNIP